MRQWGWQGSVFTGTGIVDGGQIGTIFLGREREHGDDIEMLVYLRINLILNKYNHSYFNYHFKFSPRSFRHFSISTPFSIQNFSLSGKIYSE